jgi:Tfp pilus assembly ATPase PilU
MEELGYRMIRICQKIVLADKENWENQLKNAINSEEELIKIGSIYKISGE